MPRYIEQIINIEGSNEYREGSKGGVIRPYDSEQRRAQYTGVRKSLGVQRRQRLRGSNDTGPNRAQTV